MGIEFEVIMDFAGSLAVVAILASGYGTLQRYLQQPAAARVVLGVLFGLVAWAQMHAPFEAMPGLIVDLRNVPVALAGAFLGRRGLLACLMIGLAARLQIGGVGALAGCLGMVIAGCAGLLWAHFTDAIPKRAGPVDLDRSVVDDVHPSGGRDDPAPIHGPVVL
ncbi:MAG: LytS/YhcK type 5TM receptor domain-containing protein [Pseudomonadota bacterium]